MKEVEEIGNTSGGGLLKKAGTWILFAAILLLARYGVFAQKPLSADMVLQRIRDKLIGLTLLGYDYRFEYSYPAQGRSTERRARAFLDLKPANGAARFRYQFTNPEISETYNGTDRFTLDKKAKKLYIDSRPSFRSFGHIYLQNSPLSLKYAIPEIIANRSIEKNVALVKQDGRDLYVLDFSLPKGIINSAGEIVEIRPEQINRYELKVDKATLLPLEVIQSNDKNDEVVKSVFAGITETPALPPDLSWYFSTYQK